jgi:hypothetical protein
MSPRLVRGYLYVLMAGLFLQGAGSLLFRLVPSLPAHSPLIVRGVFGVDFWHSWVHILWGAAGVALLLLRPGEVVATRLALVFGVFYTTLGVLGVSLHHPFGLQLGNFENSFHLTAGPLTLLVGALALRRKPLGQPDPGPAR